MAWTGAGSAGRPLTNSAVLETVASYTRALEPDVGTPEESSGQHLSTTPSADPELWAAIYASLDEQGKQRRRHLARHLSDAAPDVAARLRCERLELQRCSPEGITHFLDPEEAAAERGRGGTSPEASTEGGGGGGARGGDSGLVLPSFAAYPAAVRDAVLGQLCNEALLAEAEAAGVVNCVPGCTSQLVLATLGDGNCLAHAASLGTWGVHDRDARLRAAVRATMGHPRAGAAIRARFERQLAASGIPREGWEPEWRRELASLADSSTYLSDVHVFTLANVLRRPLVIFGDGQAAAAGLSGIFLPLLWPRPAAQCSRQPVAVLYGWSHFSLLCTVAGEGPATPPLLPLSTRDGPLPPRFLSAEEEAAWPDSSGSSGGYGSGGSCGGDPDPLLRLLRRFLDAERLFNGTLGARLSAAPRPHVLVDLLGSTFLRQAAQAQAAEAEAAAQAPP